MRFEFLPGVLGIVLYIEMCCQCEFEIRSPIIQNFLKHQCEQILTAII